MLRKAKDMNGYKLSALDGEIGAVQDFYFDDQSWTVRYLIADTGGWLGERTVLISPYALEPAKFSERVIPVDLTKHQIESSPSLAAHKPVSRQYEMQYYPFFGWPAYWDGPYAWGPTAYPARNERWMGYPSRTEAGDPHLRSTHDVTGHHIHAKDGDIGHVDDFVIDDESWAIRYLIVDTRNWFPGKKVLVSPQWIRRVSWSEAKIFANLSREAIKHSPEISEEAIITRDYEMELYRHYNQPGYWAKEPPIKENPLKKVRENAQP